MKRTLTLRMLMQSFGLVAVLGLAAVSCSKKQNVAEEGGSTETYSVDQNDVNSGRADSDSNNAMGMKTIYFPFDSSELTGDAGRTLKANAEIMKANPEVKIQIEGHCDERGGIQYNLALGERRSGIIKRKLQSMGVAASRIETISFGKEKPVAMGHTESDFAQNRRGNFVITSK